MHSHGGRQCILSCDSGGTEALVQRCDLWEKLARVSVDDKPAEVVTALLVCVMMMVAVNEVKVDARR